MKENELALELASIQGAYFADVLAQPEALRATWNSLRSASVPEAIARACAVNRFQRVVLTGMGASYFGLHPLNIELAAHGWTPVMLETSELIHYYAHLLTPSTLVVAVSQSGASAETVRLLDVNGKKATLIGVTNSAGSPLAQRADFAVLTAAGDEYSVSCKTYVATQMAQSLLGAALCNLDPAARLEELQPAAPAVESYLGGWQTHVAEFADLLRETRDIFLVGRGPSLAAACTGALIIKESDLFHAEGMSSAGFRHGPMEMLGPDMFVGVLGGDVATRKLNDGLMQDLARTPAKSAMMAADAAQPACRIPEAAPSAVPIVEILAVQMITLALGAMTGRQPGQFVRGTKVTVVE